MNAFEAKGTWLKLGNSHQGLICGLRACVCVRVPLLPAEEFLFLHIVSKTILFVCSVAAHPSASPVPPNTRSKS